VVETPEERLRRVTSETISIVPYDAEWPARFELEKQHLLACLPSELVVRIEHEGSTAVPGLAAKPIVDMLVEVTDLAAVRERVVPILESQGYDYFWSPTKGDDVPPFYAFFIKRDPATGARTHHIHLVEKDFVERWDELLFRDFLIAHPDVAREYEALKRRLAAEFPTDRVRYTDGKTDFITAVMRRAKGRPMEDCRIDFDSLSWESPLPGVRHKSFEHGGTKLRLAEYSRDFVAPDWCTESHVGYVLEGEVDIDFDGHVERFSAGDGLFIPEGEEHRHKPTVVTDVVRLVLVERVGRQVPQGANGRC